MTGLIFGLFSFAWILFASMLYHVNAAKKSVPAEAICLKKRAGQIGAMGALLMAAAILLSTYS
ncbi:hypothetical protein [Domibacillus epiphyticus]|uniref:Uncharacterized protein n=1 Tax=Domibacillus epiphyticus TaxID=1714355 RepID=A0A1V2A810_9BACI|nr:hypothetical protein [Domibacillus epiphyticus]OMP67133.1 hypothetical protein BTO28_09135 [Domibacillus epiphyticus]